jgi:hypothetical protein
VNTKELAGIDFYVCYRNRRRHYRARFKASFSTYHKISAVTVASNVISVNRDFFYAFGEIKSVVVVYKSRCAFINYATRVGAENAAERTSETGCIIKGHTLRVAWGRPRPQGPRTAPKEASSGTGSGSKGK